MCVCVCVSVCGLSEDSGHLRTQSFLNKQEIEESTDVSKVQRSCSTPSLACCIFTAARSIYSISMVLSLLNHISNDLKSHTCCRAIYLDAGFIASNLSLRELCIPLCFVFCVCMCISVCACVSIAI